MAIPGVALGQDISSAWGNQVADAINNLVPRGTVWMGYYAAEPDGWAFMDGREVSRTDGEWAPLYAAIGAYCGPGNGVTTWNLPLAADRFPAGIGATVGGLGGTGGWKDAVLVQHSHTVNSHSHGGNTGDDTPDHAHNANHGHTADDNATGSHDHAVDGDFGTRVVISHGAGVDRLGTPAGGTQTPVTVSTIDPNGTHDHNITVNANNFNTAGATARHHHAIPAESPGTNQQGVVATNRNMPPWLALAFIVKK